MVFTSKIQWHVNCLSSQMKLNVIKTSVGLIWSIIMLYKVNENCFFPKSQFIKIIDIKIRYYKITWSMYTLIAISNSLIFLSKQQFIRMPKGYIWQPTWLIFSHLFCSSKILPFTIAIISAASCFSTKSIYFFWITVNTFKTVSCSQTFYMERITETTGLLEKIALEFSIATHWFCWNAKFTIPCISIDFSLM